MMYVFWRVINLEWICDNARFLVFGRVAILFSKGHVHKTKFYQGSIIKDRKLTQLQFSAGTYR